MNLENLWIVQKMVLLKEPHQSRIQHFYSMNVLGAVKIMKL